MSYTVDERAVDLRFDTKNFESGVNKSISLLDKLKVALQFKGANAGLEELNNSLAHFDLYSIENSIAALEYRFSSLGIIGMTAIQNITNKVINLGTQIGTKLVSQIKQGGIARYKNIAQAKFQIEGLDADWKKLYEDMDYAVSGTAYGIDEAAVVASSLAASGKEAGDGMKAALRAVSGVAAMTNSSYSEIGQIFTTVAGNGRLMSMQLNQLAYKGLNAAATLAKAKNTTEENIRDLVSKGKISFDEFAQAMDDAFGEHAKDANKMFEGSLLNLKAALSRIGENFARPVYEGLINPLNSLRLLADAVKKKLVPLTGILTDGSWHSSPFGKFINDLTLKFTYLIDNIRRNDLGSINKTVSRLNKLFTVGSKVIRSSDNPFNVMIDFFEKSKKVTSSDLDYYPIIIDFLHTASNVSGIVSNFFTSLKNIVSMIFSAFNEVFGLRDVSTPLRDISGSLYDLSSAMTFTEKDAEKLKPILITVFSAIKTVLDYVISNVPKAINAVRPLFVKMGTIFDNFKDVLKNITEEVKEFVMNSEALQFIWSRAKGIFNLIVANAENVLDVLKNLFNSIKDMDFKKALKIGGLAYLIIYLLNFRNTLKWIKPTITTIITTLKNIKSAVSIISTLNWVLDGITWMGQGITYAIVIKEISRAILVLAAALLILTLVDQTKLNNVGKVLLTLISAIGTIILVLTGVAALSHAGLEMAATFWTLGGLFKSIAASILLLVVSLLLLTRVDIHTVEDNLKIVVSILVGLAISIALFSTFLPSFSWGALAIVAIAAAFFIIAASLKSIETIDVNNIRDKLAYLLLAVAGLITTAKFISTLPITNVLGVLALIASIFLIEKALNYIAEKGMDYKTVKDNIDKFAIVIVVFGALLVALKSLNKTMPDTAIGKNILLVVASLLIIVLSLKMLSNIDGVKLQNATTSLIIVVLGLIGIMYGLKKLTDGNLDYKAVSKALLKIAAVILIISLALKILSTANSERLLLSVVAISFVMVVMLEMIKQISELTGKVRISNLLALSLIILAAGLALTALSLLPDTEKALFAAVAIGIVLMAVTESLEKISDSANKMNMGLITSVYAIILMIVAIGASLALLTLAAHNPAAMGLAVLGVILVLVVIVDQIVYLSKAAGKVRPSILITIVAAIMLLLGISVSLALLSSLSGGSDALAVSVLSLILTLFAITAVIVKLSQVKISISALGALAIAVGALLLVAASMKLLLSEDLDVKKMLITAGVLVGILVLVAVAIGILSSISAATADIPLLTVGLTLTVVLIALSIVMLAFAKALDITAIALKKLTEIDYKAIDIAALLKLSGALALLGVTSLIAGVGFAVLAVGLTLAMVGLTVIMLAFSKSLAITVEQLTKLTKLDYKAIDTSKLLMLSVALIAIGAASLIGSAGIIALGVALGVLGVSLSIIAVAVSLVVSTVTKFVAAIVKLVGVLIALNSTGSATKKTLNTLVAAIGKMIVTSIKSVALGIVEFSKIIIENADKILQAITVIVSGIVVILFEAILKITEAVVDGIINLLTLLDEKLPIILEKLGSMLTKIIVFLIKYAPLFGFAAAYISVSFISGAIDGLIKTAPKLVNRLVILAAVLLGGFADALVGHGDILNNAVRSLINSIVYTIMNVLDAVTNGFLSSFDGYKGVMDELAAEQETLADERARMTAEIEKESYIDEKKNGSSDLKKQNNLIMEEATDSTEVADKNGKKAGDTYLAGAEKSLNGGKDRWMDTVNSIIPVGDEIDTSKLEVVGENMDNSIANGVENNKNIVSIPVENLPQDAVDNLKKQGYGLDETGKNLVKEMAGGIEEETDNGKVDDALGKTESVFDQFGIDMSDKSETSIGNWNDGLIKGLLDGDFLEQLKQGAIGQADTIKDGFNTEMDSHSPSKEGEKATNNWVLGLLLSLNSVSNNNALREASEKNANNIIDSFSTAVQDVDNILSNDMNYNPTITPVIDDTNINQFSSSLPDMFYNTGTIRLAETSTMELQNNDNFKLGQKIDQLNSNINKMANQDLSKIMDGVNINVNANTTVDGHQLRKTSAQYTIGQINKQEMGYAMATGGRL